MGGGQTSTPWEQLVHTGAVRHLRTPCDCKRDREGQPPEEFQHEEQAGTGGSAGHWQGHSAVLLSVTLPQDPEVEHTTFLLRLGSPLVSVGL